jgi:AbrB family looped-hinge helix DNA binding protein
MLATLDKFGRVLIPKKFREHLGITTNTSINILDDGDRIIIEPIKEKEAIIEKDGFLIFTGKIQGNIEQELSSNRSRRMSKLLFSGE